MLFDSFVFACFVSFVEFTTRSGNIFDFYRYWLIDKFFKGDSPNLLKSDLYDYMEQEIDSKWYKVLVGCKYCYQFWLSIPFALWLDFTILEFIIFVSTNYFFIRIIDYVESKN